jgi:hypothetical protein
MGVVFVCGFFKGVLVAFSVMEEGGWVVSFCCLVDG